jgi:hypothetical protein
MELPGRSCGAVDLHTREKPNTGWLLAVQTCNLSVFDDDNYRH